MISLGEQFCDIKGLFKDREMEFFPENKPGERIDQQVKEEDGKGNDAQGIFGGIEIRAFFKPGKRQDDQDPDQHFEQDDRAEQVGRFGPGECKEIDESCNESARGQSGKKPPQVTVQGQEEQRKRNQHYFKQGIYAVHIERFS